MKRQIIKKNVGFFIFAGLILAAFAAAPVYAQEILNGSYQFGPGARGGTSGDSVFLRVPARTNVSMVVFLQRDLMTPGGMEIPGNVPVVIEVTRPDGTAAAAANASASVISAGLPVPSIPLIGGTSQGGCPDRWRVRIRTQNQQTPPVRIFGTVVFTIVRPPAVNLNIDELTLDRNSNGTRNISAHAIFGAAPGNLIAGTGRFRIRARWHTDPLDVPHFGQHTSLTVELLRPDNSPAAREEGFSNHSGRAPIVDFTYNVTREDARMTGAWKIKVTNHPSGWKIVGFDIEKSVDALALNAPAFNSTFTAQCTEAIGVG